MKPSKAYRLRCVFFQSQTDTTVQILQCPAGGRAGKVFPIPSAGQGSPYSSSSWTLLPTKSTDSNTGRRGDERSRRLVSNLPEPKNGAVYFGTDVLVFTMRFT